MAAGYVVGGGLYFTTVDFSEGLGSIIFSREVKLLIMEEDVQLTRVQLRTFWVFWGRRETAADVGYSTFIFAWGYYVFILTL